MKITIKAYGFSQISIGIMCAIFILNLFFSRDGDLLGILLSGGGGVVDHLGESYVAVFGHLQLYRLITYGYTQTAIWHLLSNAIGLYYVGRYLEKRIGTIRFMGVYHLGLAVAGTAIFAFYPDSFNYGASPAIFACLGILANWAVRDRELWREYKSQKGFYFLVYYAVLSNLLGICTLLLHFLGFCTGFLLGFAVKEKKCA